MSKLLSRGLLLAVMAMLCACSAAVHTESSVMAPASRIYILNDHTNYREILSDFVSEHALRVEIYDRGVDGVFIEVHAGKVLTRQLNQQFRDAGINTTVDNGL